MTLTSGHALVALAFPDLEACHLSAYHLRGLSVKHADISRSFGSVASKNEDLERADWLDKREGTLRDLARYDVENGPGGSGAGEMITRIHHLDSVFVVWLTKAAEDVDLVTKAASAGILSWYVHRWRLTPAIVIWQVLVACIILVTSTDEDRFVLVVDEAWGVSGSWEVLFVFFQDSFCA